MIDSASIIASSTVPMLCSLQIQLQHYFTVSLTVFTLCSPIRALLLTSDKVDEQSVYLCTGQPLPADITNVGWMLNENFSTAYESNAG